VLFFANNRLKLSDHLQYYNQIWYQVAPLSRDYQISRQLDNAFAPLRKQKTKKKRRNSANFWRFIALLSRKHLAWFSWNFRLWCWPAFPALKSFSFIKVSWSYVGLYVKIALLFFLTELKLTGVARRLLGPHDTLPCVLIHGMKLNDEWYNAKILIMYASMVLNSYKCSLFQLHQIFGFFLQFSDLCSYQFVNSWFLQECYLIDILVSTWSELNTWTT